MSVDWLSTLRRASWRGVPFHVESDDVSVGRRLVVHQFPNRDRPFVEDLGEEAITYSVTAYVASDAAIGEASALVKACRTRGASTLVLPVEGAVRARCQSCTRTHDRDRMGYIAFGLDFVEAGVSLSAAPFGLLERLVGLSYDTALSSITGAFINQFDLVRADSWVVESALAEFDAIVDTVDAIASSTRMNTANASGVGRLIERFARDREVILADGRDSVLISQTSLGLASIDVADGAFITRADEIFTELRENAYSEQDAYEAFATLADYEADETTLSTFAVGGTQPTTTSIIRNNVSVLLAASNQIAALGFAGSPETTYGVSGMQDANNLQAMRSGLRRLSLGHMAIAASEADWKTREAAINARAAVVELYERELESARAATDVYQAMAEVRGKTAQAITEKIADLDPAIVIEAQAVLPSIVWAYRLYEDANRSSDLVERNDIAHPSFMPTEFEAEAPIGLEETVSDRRRSYGLGG